MPWLEPMFGWSEKIWGIRRLGSKALFLVRKFEKHMFPWENALFWTNLVSRGTVWSKPSVLVSSEYLCCHDVAVNSIYTVFRDDKHQTQLSLVLLASSSDTLIQSSSVTGPEEPDLLGRTRTRQRLKHLETLSFAICAPSLRGKVAKLGGQCLDKVSDVQCRVPPWLNSDKWRRFPSQIYMAFATAGLLGGLVPMIFFR